MTGGPVGVVGATGYTGRLIVRELVARGREFVAVARDAERLRALPGNFERRVAGLDGVRDAIAGCSAIVACIGPFVDLGEPTVRAAVEAGTHYVDTTGEQAFMKTVLERFDEPARQAGVAIVPGMGFDYVPGDMGAALAARALSGGRASTVEIAYLARKVKASDGTKRTGLRIAAMPCLVYEHGALVAKRIGDDEGRFAFPDGEHNVALWPGGEPLTVPRHTGAESVRVFMRMPKVAARIARTATLASPLLGPGRALIGDATGGPSDEDRSRARFAVVAEARSGSERVRCVIEGHDMYGMTAAACVEALERMAGPGYDRRGALAPAEAFEPGDFLNALGNYLSWRLER